MPRASVAIPVLNDREGLRTALDALDRQSLRSELQVIVVDNGSTDGSFELALDRAEVIDQIEGGRGSSAARNRALELATTPYLLTLDADTWPIGSDWAATHLDVLQHAPADVLATAGPLLPAPTDDRFAKRLDVTPHAPLVDGRPLYAVNGSACYRTQHLRDIGGYPDVGANDSGVGRVARARGLRFEWVPEAVAYHRNPPGLRSYLRQMRKVGQYVAEQDDAPAPIAPWLASQIRHILSRCRPIVHGDIEEAFAGALAAAAQTYGAWSTWRNDERPERPWLAPAGAQGDDSASLTDPRDGS